MGTKRCVDVRPTRYRISTNKQHFASTKPEIRGKEKAPSTGQTGDSGWGEANPIHYLVKKGGGKSFTAG